jgi:hypothetical protein
MPNPNWNVVRAEGEAKGPTAQFAESELPDDLCAVADQLIDDAEHLESQYPPRSALALPALPAAKSRTAIWRRATAAVLLIAVGAGAALLAQRLFASRESAINPMAARREPLAMESPKAGALPANSAGVQEVSFDRDAPRPKLTEVEMLRIQLDAFEKVIRKLQDELTERQKSEAQTRQLVELLRHEIDDLRQQLDEGDRTPAK